MAKETQVQDMALFYPPDMDTGGMLPPDYGDDTSGGFTPSDGETNALYAAITENEISDDGLDYLRANRGTRSDFLSTFSDFADSVGNTIRRVGNTSTQVAQSRARNQWLQDHAYTPSLGEQWNALSTYEKFGFIAALIGLVYALKHRGG